MWTESTEKFIRNNYQLMSDSELASRLRRLTGIKITPKAIEHRRAQLGLVKKQGGGLLWELNKERDG